MVNNYATNIKGDALKIKWSLDNYNSRAYLNEKP